MKTNKITIGIDGNEANVLQKVGINTYAFELLKNIALLQDQWKNDLRLIVYLKNKPGKDMPKETQNFKYKVIPGSGNWILTKLTPFLLFTNEKPDIFFAPTHYLPPFATMPKACSIMDLGYLEFSGQFKKFDFWQLKVWTAISIYISNAILSISENTKNDIVRHYPVVKNRIYVTPLGFDYRKFNDRISDEDVRRVKNKYSIVSDYVLYVGTLKPSKNVEGLIKAFNIVKEVTKKKKKDSPRYKKPVLVIAGKKGWHYDNIYKLVKELDLSDQVIFTDFVPEKDKPALIKGALVFAIPSFWEGFGLDALSAMASGVPVVASNMGSLPEVVGQAGVLVDPGNPQDIARGLNEVIFGGEKKYNRLKALGKMQASEFSWEKCALQTLNILKGLKK